MSKTPDNDVYGIVFGTYAVTLDLIIKKTQPLKGRKLSPELSAFHSTVHTLPGQGTRSRAQRT